VGGRVLTQRDGFALSQHAEAGGDMIDAGHRAIHDLAAALGLKLNRILRGGWGMVRADARGRPRRTGRAASGGWDRLERSLSDLARVYRLAERRWDSPIAGEIAGRSVAQWLDDTNADNDLRAIVGGLRGFFLADPEELSLLALVDQFAEDSDSWPPQTYRIAGGNDRLATALAAPLGDRLHFSAELVSVSARGRRVRARVKTARQIAEIEADYLVVALPATTLRRIPFSPALPERQHRAIAGLQYGRATKTLLQFSHRFWRAPDRPRAFGSPPPIGALWEGNEEQPGRMGILSLLAGGAVSDATADVMRAQGASGLVSALGWLGAKKADLVASYQTVWENEPWSKGGYAFFDPGFDPLDRDWLSRPRGSIFFAGEHTSLRWQGYMNGAVESGQRAAAEIVATHALRRRLLVGTSGVRS
jgi:monoamine oxidase